MSRESVAHHEAGHVVARIDLKLPLTSATIIPTEDALGHVLFGNIPKSVYEAVEFGSSLTPKQNDRVERELVSTLAGPAADTRYRGRRNKVGARQDYQDVAEWVGRTHSSRGGGAWVAYLEVLADELIEARWDVVRAIAAALLTHGTLDKAELLDVYRRALQLPDWDGPIPT